MGIFTIIAVASELISNDELRSNITTAGTKGFNAVAKLFDTDGDGDFDEDEVNNLLEYVYMVSSILGQSAQADGIIQEEEEEIAWELLNDICFEEDGIFTEDILEIGNIKKKKLKKKLIKKFQEPYSIKKIAKYGVEKEIEEVFYRLACLIVGADEKIENEERELLDELGSRLDLPKFDMKRIEKENL